jgi:hypothetical protein
MMLVNDSTERLRRVIKLAGYRGGDAAAAYKKATPSRTGGKPPGAEQTRGAESRGPRGRMAAFDPERLDRIDMAL